MIACDIDGTLLNREETISPTITALIRLIVDGGVQFVLITRRHHDAAEFFSDQLRLETPIISLDGALTRLPHSATPTNVMTFDQQFARNIIEEIRNSGDVDFCAVTSERLLVSNQDMALPAHHEFWNIETQEIDGSEEIQDTILEIAATGDFFGVNRMYNYVDRNMRKGELRMRLYESHHKAGKWHFEIRSNMATKVTALDYYLKTRNIPFRDVIGIGDHYNDVDFCKKTGYVVTVRNAIKQMKEMADFITERDCFDDGLAEFFEAFLNIRGVDTSGVPGLQKTPGRNEPRRR